MYWITWDQKESIMQSAQMRAQWQQALTGNRVPYLQYNPAQGIPMQYFEGMANNRQVTCAYCRTGRESRHKTCKGCGASEVMHGK